jgi:hypothetical protein
VVSGIHLWIENTPQRFASAVVAAVGGSDRFHIARSARNYVERHHNWAQNLSALDQLLAHGGCEQTVSAEDRPGNAHPANQSNFTPEKSADKFSSAGASQ